MTDTKLYPSHPQWATVLAKLQKTAERNLNVRIESMQVGANAFRDDADTMIDEYIKEPPKDLGAFAAIADAVMGGIGVFFPAGKLSAEVFEAVKMVYDQAKIAKGVWDSAQMMEVSRTVDGAKAQLKGLVKKFAEEFSRNAVQGYQNALGALDAQIEQYLINNPPLVPTDDNAYAELCERMGLGKTPDYMVDEFVNQLMPPFRKALMTQTGSIHFFKELENDFERLNFLIDEDEKGNPVEPLLELIGADVVYWKQFLDVYSASGRVVANTTLQYYLTAGRMPD